MASHNVSLQMDNIGRIISIGKRPSLEQELIAMEEDAMHIEDRLIKLGARINNIRIRLHEEKSQDRNVPNRSVLDPVIMPDEE